MAKIKKKNKAYPYTCPFWKGNYDSCERMVYEYPFIGCSLGRSICIIILDMDNPEHPKDAETLMKNIIGKASEEELETIRLNVSDFYRNHYKKLIGESTG